MNRKEKKSKLKILGISAIGIVGMLVSVGLITNIVKSTNKTSNQVVAQKIIKESLITISNNSFVDQKALDDEIIYLNYLKETYADLTYGFYKDGKKVDEVKDSGPYKLVVEIKESTDYKAYKEEVNFEYFIPSTETIKSHMEAIDDRWGTEGSVIVNTSKVKINDEFVEFEIENAGSDKESAIGGCMYSNKYYYNTHCKFSIFAKTNLSKDGFGMFGFWITGYEWDGSSSSYKDNSYKELVFELLKGDQINVCSGIDPESYLVEHLTANFDFNEWHQYTIDYTGDTCKFLVDNVMIHEITENLPDSRYSRINFGLLYPTYNWTGRVPHETSILNSQKAYVCNLEAVGPSGREI